MVFTTVDIFPFSQYYTLYTVLQAKIVLSIPALTVFGCFLYLLKKEQNTK